MLWICDSSDFVIYFGYYPILGEFPLSNYLQTFIGQVVLIINVLFLSRIQLILKVI